MTDSHLLISRRSFLSGTLMLSLLPWCSPLLAGTSGRIVKVIPATNEPLPVIGLGTSRTFDVSSINPADNQLLAIIRAFFESGGGMIDSSPMYGNAENVTGQLLQQVQDRSTLFAATKVWTDGREEGIDPVPL